MKINMLQFIKYFFIFLLINFGGLALGALWTNPGTASEWYETINMAPWTPPGWVFGFAWTTIGITYSLWGAYVMKNLNHGDNETPILYIESVILNIIWNPIFFGLHWLNMAGFVLIALLVCLIVIAKHTRHMYGWKPTLLLLPYIIWLGIANSLNWYIILNN